MTIYAKIGTHPGSYVRVLRKRKLPVVGERFEIIYKEHRRFVYLHEIVRGDRDMFVLERM
jgi:hypothetical protein